VVIHSLASRPLLELASETYEIMRLRRPPRTCARLPGPAFRRPVPPPDFRRDRCHRALLNEQVIIGYSDQSGERVSTPPLESSTRVRIHAGEPDNRVRTFSTRYLTANSTLRLHKAPDLAAVRDGLSVSAARLLRNTVISRSSRLRSLKTTTRREYSGATSIGYGGPSGLLWRAST